MTATRTSKLALTSAFIVFPLIGLSAGDRIQGQIENGKPVQLKGHVPPKAAIASDRGMLEASTLIHDIRLILDPAPRQSAELASLLEEQRDPSSPNYQNWLTPEQYGERFGLNENDLGKLTAWLQTQGFSIDQVARAKNWITFSGNAGQLHDTFGTELHRYQADGKTHFGTAKEPSVPASLAGVITAIRGLDDFRPNPPRNRRSTPDYTTASGTHYLAPDDLTTIYDIAALYKAGFDGTGQKLAIAGQTDIKLSDIQAFRSQFNLPVNNPQLVLAGTDPGTSSDDQVEANLDVEWSGAVARNATIIYVYSPNVFESLQYAIDQNLAPIISLSYGGCELGSSTSYRTMAQQANAEGITWMNASGDSGAAGCDNQGEASASKGPAVTFPADIPEVTAVGGTEFNEGSGAFWNSQNTTNWGSATSYIPEKGWNDTNLGDGIEGSGGGASQLYAKPWWQSGPGVPNDNARDVPDVALSASGAHDGYIMYVQGGLYVVGGTSAASPSFAGIVTLINHYLVSKGLQAKPGLGNINPTLYSLAQNSTSAFHDITVGNNIVPCTSGSPGCVSGALGFSAGPGYDQVTGLGSVDAFNLATSWASSPTGTGTTTVLTANPASIAPTASTVLTAKVTPVTGSNPTTGSVTFSLGNTVLGSASLVPSATAAAGTAPGSTASLTVKGSTLVTGVNTITASYSATGSFTNSTATATVTITGPAAAPVNTTSTLTATPTSIAPGGSSQLVVTIKAASGTAAPTGSVKFSVGTTAMDTLPLTSSGAISTVTMTVVAGGGVTPGPYTFGATYAPTGNFNASSATTNITVTSPPVATTMTVSASSTSLTATSTASAVITATVKAASGTAAPTGSIAFTLGKTSLGTATLANGIGTLTVNSGSLATGANAIVVTYTATGNFTTSTGTVTITVVPPTVSTTTTLLAAPAGILTTGSTVLTATIKPATGTASPTGNVSFTLGTKSLGSATVTAGKATLTIQGTSLTVGSNTISVAYTATGSFANSAATTPVTVTAPPTTTAVNATATPNIIASTATTELIATVKAATGVTLPTGNLAFSLGNTLLGSAALSSVNGVPTATLTVKGTSLATGTNNISIAYPGSTTFAASTNLVTVSVTAPAPAKTSGH